MKRLLLLTFGSVFLIQGCVQDILEGDQVDFQLESAIRATSPTGLDYFILPQSNDFAAIPQDPKNPLTEEKVQLGQFLFFETGLGVEPMQPVGMQTYSCSSCHIPSADFKSGRKQGIGDGGVGFGFNGESRIKNEAYEEFEMDVQGVRPLNVLNLAFSAKNTLWNGQFGATGANEGTEDMWGVLDERTATNHLGYEGDVATIIEALDIHRLIISKEVLDDLGYTSYFDAIFPEFPEDKRYTRETASLALAAYLRTLMTTEAPFQRWLKGDLLALSEQEKRGALLFFTDANCTSCHSSPAFSATKFFAVGVNDLNMQVSFNEGPATNQRNSGRGGFTGKEEDMFKFKVPTLYNLDGTPFYFHGSSKRSIREVVEYFNKAVPENPNVPKERIAAEFKPLYLTEEEIDDMVAFLQYGLKDRNVERYQPSSLPTGSCFPNADWKSRRDLGCE